MKKLYEATLQRSSKRKVYKGALRESSTEELPPPRFSKSRATRALTISYSKTYDKRINIDRGKGVAFRGGWQIILPSKKGGE